MDKFMAMAIEEAKATKAEGGSPFGAVLIRGEEVIGIGRNSDDPEQRPAQPRRDGSDQGGRLARELTPIPFSIRQPSPA